ncbi:MAG: T9SS type A sorting domain-containing protein [Saprospiraceae bacterium]|nr:T9SS type A sorting domain-containing protein [Saprospiraceae bacterium]
MVLRFLLLLNTVFFINTIYGQYVPMDISLTENNNVLKNPWAGGMNLPQFSEVDLNNDGILDLVSYDREGIVASTFINGGSTGIVDYHYAPEYMKHIPQEVRNFMLFRDYNCDGIEDIFGMYEVWGQGLGIAVWKGSYDANDTIQFTLVKDQLKYDVGSTFLYKMFLYNTDLPAIDDIDGDGDLDILAFTMDIFFPNNVFWYKNTSVENGYGCDSLDFDLETQCWGLFAETGDSSIVNFGPSIDSCFNNPYFSLMEFYEDDKLSNISRNGRHIGANLTTVDFNGDNVKDMALGGVTYKNVNMISGIEINDTILISTQDHKFPSYDEPIDIYSFVSTYFLDVNNDGKTDMLASPSELAIGESITDSVAWYYQNVGTNNNMVFNFQQKDFLVGEMLDIGYRAFPAIFDYNLDGLYDIVLGSFGRTIVGGGFNYGMTLLENTGSVSNPSFNLVTYDYAGLSSLMLNGLYPTFGDLDGDGDVDMICGAQDGRLTYVENIAGPLDPAVWDTPVLYYKGIDVGDASAPFLVDLDRDGDLDLVVGQYTGTIHYFENSGTPTVPDFSPVGSPTNLGGYSVQNSGSRNAMPFVYDNNGAYELFIGHKKGNIIHLGNIDINIFGVYDTLSTNFMEFYQGTYTDIAVCDIDNDTKLDYLLGTGRGGLMVMTEKDTLTELVNVDMDQKIINVYPNPAYDILNVAFLHQLDGNFSFTVYNTLGHEIYHHFFKKSDINYQLNISDLPCGVYFVDVQAKNYNDIFPFIKQ